MQAPGQGKPSSSGRPRKRTVEDFEEEDLYLPTNGRKRYRVSCLPKQWSACPVWAAEAMVYLPKQECQAPMC